MPAVVTPEEKVRARHHLGYHNVESVMTFQLGVPAAMQTSFMIEGALDRIMSTPGAIEKFRQILCRLDAIENQVFCGSDLADVEVLDTITINRKRLRELAQYYSIGLGMLENLLGIVRNPWDKRAWVLSADGGINVPVAG